ncbi:MAG: ChaN family lipoprotein [Xenococcaceae cyanobacterium]
MKISKLAQVCAWLLGTVFLCTLIAYLQKGLSLPPQQSYSHPEIISELVQANIVYLGETHDSLEDHEAQLEIIQGLYQQNSQVAIALEMFQRPYQQVLDQYLAGQISEAELREQTEYDQRWGFDWEFYAPILRFAKAHQLPVLALNTPAEVTGKVSRQGLESLTPEELRYIPPVSEIRTDNEDYRQMVREVYEKHAHGGDSNSKGFEQFFTAQVLWDETMAEKIAQFWQGNPDYQIIVLAGRGHIIYGYGIPSRVARRLEGNSFVQRSVLMGDSQDIEFKGEQPPADYFWKHE